jgi:hypothetical protein
VRNQEENIQQHVRIQNWAIFTTISKRGHAKSDFFFDDDLQLSQPRLLASGGGSHQVSSPRPRIYFTANQSHQ